MSVSTPYVYPLKLTAAQYDERLWKLSMSTALYSACKGGRVFSISSNAQLACIALVYGKSQSEKQSGEDSKLLDEWLAEHPAQLRFLEEQV